LVVTGYKKAPCKKQEAHRTMMIDSSGFFDQFVSFISQVTVKKNQSQYYVYHHKRIHQIAVEHFTSG
jgi:hypothetical protein